MKKSFVAFAILIMAFSFGVRAQTSNDSIISDSYHGSVIKNVSMWTLEIVSGSHESEATEFILNQEGWLLKPGSSMYFEEEGETTFSLEARKGGEKKSLIVSVNEGQQFLIDEVYISEWGF